MFARDHLGIVRYDLPSGTVTFLFTDVEGSTKLLHELGARRYAEVLVEHRRVIRVACKAEGGVEVDTQGDAFFFAFATAPGALAAAQAFTETLAAGAIRVRVGVHTGQPLLSDEGYVGDDVHLAARVAASGHGGQVLLSSATAGLVELPVSDLGEHRLKDIPDAVAIFQLGEKSFPPLRTISNTNLPRPASSFVGREAVMGEVLGRIERGARLLTLTGPGGTGKTRLALEVAGSLVPNYKAGVFWIGLASLRDPALVAETIAQVLGAKDGLAEHVRERELLLLLDNLEQVIEAAPGLAELLERCPNLVLLCTSRELLRVRGEVAYAVPPLGSPEAVTLFCERAQLEPSDEIAELCARLDNLPLAVELAAARTKSLTPAQILERLTGRLDLLRGGRDADPRQQTLRATIKWSHELLSAEERRLFTRLSVFAGGCTLHAAEEVCEADLETLQSLLEKSLLRFSDGRYWMLETIREYALDRLEESGEDEDMRRRHAEFFCRLGEQAEAELEGPEQDIWLNRISAEHDNIRSALEWSLAGTDPELGVRLASSLHQFWKIRGYGTEGRRWTDRALAAEAELEPRMEMRLLKAVVVMRGEVGDWAATQEPTMRRMQLARELGDEREVARCLNNLAGVAWKVTRDTEQAVSLFKESIALLRRLGDRIDVPLRNLARIAEDEHDYERAEALATESLVIAREVGDLKMVRDVSQIIGWIRLDQGRLREAIEIEWDVFRLAYKLRHPIALLVCVQFTAVVLARHGAARRSAELFGKGQALLEEQKIPWDPADFPHETAAMATVRTALSEEAWLEAVTVGQGADVRELLEVSLREAETAVAAVEAVEL